MEGGASVPPLVMSPRASPTGKPGHYERSESPTKNSLDNLPSSETFNRVMDDLNLRVKKSEGTAPASYADIELNEQDEVDDDDDDDDDEQEDTPNQTGPERKITKVARRAWNLLRRHTKEICMDRKTTSANMSWSFLKHTIARMTDGERARQELYDRYIKQQDDWRDGFSQHTKIFLQTSNKFNGAKQNTTPVVVQKKGAHQSKQKDGKTRRHHPVKAT